MPHHTDDVISTLNTLIETCKDGQEGFRAAAESARDGELKRLFMDHASERAAFASELQMEVRRLGGDPERSGSVAGTMHRGWLKVKATLTGSDDAAILNAAESGEDSAMKAYEDALINLGSVGVDLRSTIERQARRVREVHGEIRTLRDRRRAA
jgi:uncharacterized protein (TIGR02284 family)